MRQVARERARRKMMAEVPKATGWQELSVVAAAPTGAVAVRVHLASGGNTGTVYFSNPGWSVTGARSGAV